MFPSQVEDIFAFDDCQFPSLESTCPNVCMDVHMKEESFTMILFGVKSKEPPRPFSVTNRKDNQVVFILFGK